MPVSESLITFIFASALLSLAPGPDNLFVLTLSAVYGKRPGLWVILGLCSGLILHTLLVALGIALLIKTYPAAFIVLKLAGASYLLILAWQLWSEPADPLESGSVARVSGRALYRRGVIMNVTNPKVTIFFLAYLPQFVSPGGGEAGLQIFLLGMLFILTAFIIFIAIAILASSLGNILKRSNKIQLYLHRIASIIFVALALNLILSSTGA